VVVAVAAAAAAAVVNIDGSAPRGGAENAAADVGPAAAGTVAPDTDVEFVGAVTRPTEVVVGDSGDQGCAGARCVGTRWAASLAGTERPATTAAAAAAAAEEVRGSDFAGVVATVSPGAHIRTVFGVWAIFAGIVVLATAAVEVPVAVVVVVVVVAVAVVVATVGIDADFATPIVFAGLLPQWPGNKSAAATRFRAHAARPWIWVRTKR
jgi:hypothetical protein